MNRLSMGTGQSNKVVASNNHMLWQYYSSLSRQVVRANQADETDECKQTVALCIIMSVALIETFLNVFFQVLVTQAEYSRFSEWITFDLERRVSLERKIKVWPKLVFGRGIDFGQGVGQRFLELKDTRNWLIHFRSSFESMKFENVTFQGVADISVYEALTPENAFDALGTAVDTIAEILKSSGATEQHIPSQLHFWIGKVPN